MFDKLIESTKQKRAGRTSRFFLTTTLAYAGALMLLAVATVFWFNPALAETVDATALLTPPVPVGSPPPQNNRVQIRETPREVFASPTVPPEHIADPHRIPPSQPSNIRYEGPIVIGAPNSLPGPGNYVPAATGEGPAPPPPPAASPKPSPTATPVPEGPMHLTSQMIQSKAVRKIQPPYPIIAKNVKASGPVQIQIMISEDGTVDEATVLSGHPLLRDAALQAARQWVFSPTLLNNKPVRIVGVITFNFTLN